MDERHEFFKAFAFAFGYIRDAYIRVFFVQIIQPVCVERLYQQTVAEVFTEQNLHAKVGKGFIVRRQNTVFLSRRFDFDVIRDGW